MKLLRRELLRLAAGAAALPSVSRIAPAQTYPARPVRIIVTFPAGGSNDIHARLIGQWLSERLGHAFVVENQPGGGGSIGTAAAARAAPDGHTLVFLSPTHAINAAFYDNLPYDLLRDFVPVASLYRSHYVMLVNPALPARNVPEFIAYAKANRGQLNMGSNGVGATGHLTGELFKIRTGIDLFHIPYRGEAPEFTDLMAGRLHVVFATTSGSSELIKSGQLRAMAITAPGRSPAFPDVPTIGEFVPGFAVVTFAGLAAPRNTPAAIVDRLHAEINAALASPAIRARHAELGVSTFVSSAGDFGQLLADEVRKWAEVVRFAGLKPN